MMDVVPSLPDSVELSEYLKELVRKRRHGKKKYAFFKLMMDGRFKKDTVANCSAEVEWPPLPFFLTERLPGKGGWGTPSDCWNGRCVRIDDGDTCPCWKETD